METLWLQRSGPDVPWGFRLVGGREYGVPLCVQRVTPGSVAAAGLGPGDLVLKVGNVMATNLEHNDAMELVKQAGNILQLTIRKDPNAPAPLSPGASSNSSLPSTIDMYGNNASTNYSTTPRNYGSQHQPPKQQQPQQAQQPHQQQPQFGTRIEIQRVAPSPQAQQQRQAPQRSLSNSYNNEYSDSAPVGFPDYTIPYKQQEPVHDSPGGPVDLRSSRDNLFAPPSPAQPQNVSYSQTLPRGVVGGYNNPQDRDPFSNAGGPPAYEPPRAQNPAQSFSPSYSNHQQPQPLHLQQQQAPHLRIAPQNQTQSQPQRQPQYQQQSYAAKPVAQPSSYQPQSPSAYNNGPQSFNSPSAGPLSPQSYASPLSPRGGQPNAQPSPYSATPASNAYQSQPTTPASNAYQSQPPPLHGYGNDSFRPGSDQSNIHGYGSNTYATLPHSKPATPATNNNNSAATVNFNVYKPSAPKPFAASSQPYSSLPPNDSFAPPSYSASTASTPTNNYSANTVRWSPAPQPTQPAQPKPYQSPMSPLGSSVQPSAYQSPLSPSVQPSAYQSPMSPSVQPSAYQSPLSPGSSMQPPQRQMSRRVSFDQSTPDPSSFGSRVQHLKSPPPPEPVSSSYPTSPDYRGYNQQNDYNSTPAVWSPSQPPAQPSYSRQNSRGSNAPDPYVPPAPPTPQSYSRQNSRGSNAPDPYTSPAPYRRPSGPLSPGGMNPASGYGYAPNAGYPRGYNAPGVSGSMNNLSLGQQPYEPPSPPAPPPPPPPPSGPPPPPAPPLNSWNPTPYRRQASQGSQPDSADDLDKVPDKLLGQMIKSSKGGGPKPFSYGIDMSELKKKMGPPTAPKPRKQGARPPQGPAPVDDYSAPRGPPRKPAGQIQSDYFPSRDSGPRSEIDESSINVHMGNNPKKQSKSFRVLQWMTETEQGDEQPATEEKQVEEEEVPQKPRSRRPSQNPDIPRHNADDDEMKFSGLHSKAEIPSNTFKRLQKMPPEETPAVTENGKDTLDVADAEEGGIGNYDEASIRYKGKHIPSPSFRVLQSWAELDQDANAGPAPGSTKNMDEEDDGMPDTLNSDDMVDKRYKGGNIPSKAFKTLQLSVGSETTEEPSQQNSSEVAVAKVQLAPDPSPPAQAAAEPAPEPEVILITDDVTDF